MDKPIEINCGESMLRAKKNNLMMNEGIHVEERHFCLLCDSKGNALYQDLRDRHYMAPGIWILLKCPQCDLVWLNPQPIPKDIGKLYSEYCTHDTLPEILKQKSTKSLRKIVKFSILNSAFGYQNENAKKSLGWLFSQIGFLRDFVGGSVMWLNGSQPGKLLDVGCGSGRFLATMQDLGWEVVGVEPDRQAAKVARERFGLRIYESVLEVIGFPDDNFDAITMSHVLEHLPDPVVTLKECRRVLKKDGQLVVTVPNIKSLVYRLYQKSCLHLDPPRHLFHYSPQTLRTCVEQAELKILELRTTARHAGWMWATSRLIHLNGSLSGGLLPKQDLSVRLRGLIFQAMEEGLCLVTDAGEEIIMIAGK